MSEPIRVGPTWESCDECGGQNDGYGPVIHESGCSKRPRVAAPSDDVKPRWSTRDVAPFNATEFDAFVRRYLEGGMDGLTADYLRANDTSPFWFDQLVATARAGLEDRERLDWLERERHDVEFYEAQGLSDLRKPEAERRRVAIIVSDDEHVMDSKLRAAIDAARGVRSTPSDATWPHYTEYHWGECTVQLEPYGKRYTFLSRAKAEAFVASPTPSDEGLSELEEEAELDALANEPSDGGTLRSGRADMSESERKNG